MDIQRVFSIFATQIDYKPHKNEEKITDCCFRFIQP